MKFIPNLNNMRKNNLKIKDKEIQYFLRRSSRAKNIRLTVNQKGQLIATLPWIARKKTLENFIFKKSSWIFKKINEVKNMKPGLLDRGDRKDYFKNKQRAYDLVKEKLEKYNRFYNFSYRKIYIRNQKTRWGSCSSMGNLNFNWRIVLLDEVYADYLIVHELCHLKQLNHSKKFWALVQRTIPRYKILRKEMKDI
ncbi:MAG: DUF45 domain-containing protein [Candidatus Moranbacteria bacterium]|nr:DUF45 domain-containing protein [Candidatus Moranbacteria bacterium]